MILLSKTLQQAIHAVESTREKEGCWSDDEERIQSQLFESIHPNTELGIDLKLFTCTPGRLDIGEARTGKIVHDSEDHFTFIEDAVLKVLEVNKGSKKNATKRNPIYLPGKLINVHQKDDGTFYTTFCRPAFSPDFNFRDFCLQAAMELISISGLVEKL